MRTIMTTIRKKWKALNRVTPPSRSPTGALYRCRPSQRGPQLFRFIGRNVIRCNRIQQDIYFISLIRGVWWGILWAEWSLFSRPPPPVPTDFGILFASKKREHEHLICHHIQCQRRQTILLQGCLSFWQLGSGLGRYMNMWNTHSGNTTRNTWSIYVDFRTADVETLVVLVTLGHAGTDSAGNLLAKKWTW